ncbi:MAG: prepilin peptidase [Promethearchaeota archaeon]
MGELILIYLIFFIYIYSIISLIFFISLYKDFKFRKIPNNLLFYFFLVTIISNLFEFTTYQGKFLNFIISKLVFLFITFLFSFLLFSLKIIGGGDGKLLIIIFLLHPLNYLKLKSIIFFFFLFSLLFFIYMSVNCIKTFLFKNKNYSFKIYFEKKCESISKKIYFRSFYKFINYSNLKKSNENRYQVKNLNIFFCNYKNKFQLCVQKRPPIVILLISSYYLLFFFIGI